MNTASPTGFHSLSPFSFSRRRPASKFFRALHRRLMYHAARRQRPKVSKRTCNPPHSRRVPSANRVESQPACLTKAHPRPSRPASHSVTRFGDTRQILIGSLGRRTDAGSLRPRLIGMLECGMSGAGRNFISLAMAKVYSGALHGRREAGYWLGRPLHLWCFGTLNLGGYSKLLGVV